ncbi:hypothetical protein GCM10011594_20670 [Nakamurella endophytica]|uniref:Uncharacterized protein n=1 Tax=Nakamurella endophytica TaxID=1748367 RepID=A0A917SVC5_9ACTN|nr:hypothetical protein GCM10011594_20670 [Nakamurella endophytica]
MRTSVPPPSRGLTLGDIRESNDAVLDATLRQLAGAVESGGRAVFVAPFAPAVAGRVGQWFDNTRALGVAGARFVRTPGYFSPRRDTPTSFTRTVVLGVRTPYDDDGSLPGIAYTVGMDRRAGRWTVTTWAPSYVDDPMNCGCRLQVVHRGDVAVVSEGGRSLAGWPAIVLDRALEGTAWPVQRMAGSGLRAPAGHVFFLVDHPYRWFLSATGAPETSNATVSLVETDGPAPGTLFSTASRIVLMLADTDGRTAPQTAVGRLYAWDVVTHEATHQLMNLNSQLYYGEGDPIATWIVEGIAVAVEVLHRRDHPETADAGYYLRDDPRNVDRGWLRRHLAGDLPSREQLYAAPGAERSNWYALSGSVFLFLADRYGFPTMMRTARLMYAQNGRNPFDVVPDPDRAGRYLSRADAMAAWRSWFTDNYLG